LVDYLLFMETRLFGLTRQDLPYSQYQKWF
jgi:hypothetical protein